MSKEGKEEEEGKSVVSEMKKMSVILKWVMFFAVSGVVYGLPVNLDKKDSTKVNKKLGNSRIESLLIDLDRPVKGCDRNNNDEFDFFMLAMQWPPSFGNRLQHWTLHGLWPSRTGNGPEGAQTYPCSCTQQPFDVNDLDSIRPDMERYWPTLFPSTNSNEHFWQHEWMKHGTCAVPGLFPTEASYFEQTLLARKRYEPLEALSNVGIVPSSETSYTAVAIVNAFRAKFGAVPLLGCKMYKGTWGIKKNVSKHWRYYCSCCTTGASRWKDQKRGCEKSSYC